MKKLFTTLCFFLSFNSVAYNKCDNLYLLNFLHHDPNSPFIVSKQELTSLKLIDKKKSLLLYQETIDYLATNGIKKYSKKVLDGVYPTEIIGERQYTLLDLAVSNKASINLLDNIFNVGINLTDIGITNLLSTRTANEAFKLIEKYSDSDLNEIYLYRYNKKYSIVNFLLQQKKIDSLIYIHKHLQNKIDFLANLYTKDLVDLDQFSLDYTLKIAQLIDINEYKKKYKKIFLANTKNKSFINNLKHEYSIYSLYNPCDSEINWSTINIVGARPKSELESILKKKK